ncbi:6-bladed beta-propeller [Oligoflexia bacterium]|nr:6-bladed beta-propeller [Oligoflexia bacterium]
MLKKLFLYIPLNQPRIWLLLMILLAGTALRLTGITHGSSYHPDERHMVMVAEKLSWADMNPHSFAYGSFPFYLLWAVAHSLSPFFDNLVSYDKLFIVGRSICLTFGVAAIFLTYLLAQTIYRNPLVSLIASALLAFNVFHIQLSRFYTVDVILTTLTLAAIWGAVRIAQTGKIRFYVFTAIMIGAALATKISVLFLGLSILAALFVRQHRKGHFFDKGLLWLPLLMALLIIITFFVLEPYAYLDFETFWKNTQEQTNMVRGQWRPPYAIQYEGTTPYLYPLEQIWHYTMSWPIALLALAGLLVTLGKQFKHPKGEELILLLWILPLYLITSAFQVKYPRYLLPLYPQLFLFAAALLAWKQEHLFVTPTGEATSPSVMSTRITSKLDPVLALVATWWSKLYVRITLALMAIVILVLLAIRAVPTSSKLFEVSQQGDHQAEPRVKPHLTKANVTVGGLGLALGRFNNIMGMGASPLGELYAADMNNHRVQKFSAKGDPLLSFGKQGTMPGEFNEPRDVAVDSSGNVYVVDSWNHRIQKFDSTGSFLTEWNAPGEFYGPRGIAVKKGHVYVTDSGHKRVVTFDLEGGFVLEFGEAGSGPGQLDEPVGITADDQGNVYVVDSGNGRIQKFDKAGKYLTAWSVKGWEDHSLKEAYIVFHSLRGLLVTEPVSHSILHYSTDGVLLGVFATGLEGISGATLSKEQLFIAERNANRVKIVPGPKTQKDKH